MKNGQKIPQQPQLGKQQPQVIELSDDQLEHVQGGINPQPLPPRWDVPSIPLPPPGGARWR